MTARSIVEWIAPMTVLVLVVVAASDFVAVPWVVLGPSMEPGLQQGDRVLVDRWTFRKRKPRVGEIALFAAPGGSVMVKRVARRPAGHGAAEPGVWVLGDNRAASTDSRQFGTVSRSRLRGRVLWRYWPLSRAGRVR